MAIDKSGEHWRGTDAGDLDEFLRAYAAGGYPVARTIAAHCAACEGTRFHVRVDDEQGYAERRCAGCGGRFLMLDSEDVVDDAEPGDCACPCGGELFEVAAGFAVDGDEIGWVSVGLRCLADGVLGVYADWKIDYGPTDTLYRQV